MAATHKHTYTNVDSTNCKACKLCNFAAAVATDISGFRDT